MVAKNKKIRTLKGYMTWVAEIHVDNPYAFLFRGLPNEKWDAEASAIRRHPKYPDEVNLAWLREYNEYLIREARARDYHRKDGKEHKHDLPLLAELQHYGAATALIDFSKNPLVALWFACQVKKDKKTGKVIKTGKVVAVADNDKFLNAQSEIDKNDAPPENDKNDAPPENDKSIKHFLNGIPLWQWRSPNNNHRILAQQSIFLFGATMIESDEEIEIANKEKLLEELKNYGVDEEKLFPDFYGFANINAHNKPFDNIDYLAKGIDAIQNQKYKKAIEYFNKAITINPNDADAYHNRGLAKYLLEDYAEAIEDYSEALKINPDFAAAYYNRGIVQIKLRNYHQAIEDFNKVIAINPDFADAYHNRGVVKYQLGLHAEALGNHAESSGNYAEAIDDFEIALEKNPNNTTAKELLALVKKLLAEQQKKKNDDENNDSDKDSKK